MKEIDRQLIQTLRDVVRGREGYIYESPHHDGRTCMYRSPQGQPSCGIGHVAQRLDLPVREGVGVGKLALEWWGASEVVADALDAFQKAQDDGSEWGVALARAEVHLTRHGVVAASRHEEGHSQLT